MNDIEHDGWQARDDHPWVGKSAGVERIEVEDGNIVDTERVPGIVEAVLEYEGVIEAVVCDVDDEDESIELVCSPERVEVL